MKPIVLQGRLVSNDVWLSEPGIGTAIFVSEISVPDELETSGIYPAQISVSAARETHRFASDVVVEPEQRNAIGQRRHRTLAFATTLVLSPKDLDGSAIRLTIEPTKKSTSESMTRFRAAIRTKAQG